VQNKLLKKTIILKIIKQTNKDKNNSNNNTHISTLQNVLNFTSGTIQLQTRQDTKEPSEEEINPKTQALLITREVIRHIHRGSTRPAEHLLRTAATTNMAAANFVVIINGEGCALTGTADIDQ